MVMRVAWIGAAALVATALSVGTARVDAATTGPCRPTAANGRVPPGAPSGRFYGNGRLATVAYRSIDATPATLNADGTISQKFPWWGGPGLHGRLHIAGKRLDRRAPPLRATSYEGGVDGVPSGTRFWASGITFATPGCWRIVGRVDKVQLTLIVRVNKPAT